MIAPDPPPRRPRRAGGSPRDIPPKQARLAAGVPFDGGWRGAEYGLWEETSPSWRHEKGKRFQRDAARILRSEGWLVHDVVPVVRRRANRFWTQYEDLWNTIDLACVGDSGFLFVQVTTADNASHKRRAIEEIPWPVKTDGYRVELWLRVRGGFRVCPFSPPWTWDRELQYFRPLHGRPRSELVRVEDP